MKAKTLRSFIRRGVAAQKAVDQAIAAAAPAADQVAAALERRRLAFAPSSTPAEVADDDRRFGRWQRCGGGEANDCQNWARGDRGCPQHRTSAHPRSTYTGGVRSR